MFWQFEYSKSNIEDLLAAEDVTLKKLLDEDDVVQEVKCQNPGLINFLMEHFDELLELAITEPDDTVEMNLRFKYGNIASTILSSRVSQLSKELLKTNNFNSLWTFLSRDPPLNPLTASFFVQIINSLLHEFPSECVEFLVQDGNAKVVQSVIKHLYLSSMTDFAIQLLMFVDTGNLRSQLFHFYSKSRFVETLVEDIANSTDDESKINVVYIITELIRNCRDSVVQFADISNPIYQTLVSSNFIDHIFNTVIINSNANKNSIVSALQIMIALIEVKPIAISVIEDLKSLEDGITCVIESIGNHLDCIVRLITAQPFQTVDVSLSSGDTYNALGSLRLCAVVLLTCLFNEIATNCKSMSENVLQVIIKFIDVNAVDDIFNLFFTYYLNNLYHTQVVRLVKSLFQIAEFLLTTQKEDLGKHIYRHIVLDCQLVKRICDHWYCSNDEVSRQRDINYSGHLVQLANLIENSEVIKGIIENFDDEEVYKRFSSVVSEPLSEINRNNSLMLGGGQNPNKSSSEDDDSSKFSFSTEPALQKAFQEYQQQPITTPFIESFGIDEDAMAMETFPGTNLFDKIKQMKANFTLKADDENQNAALFESLCNQQINDNFQELYDEDEFSDGPPCLTLEEIASRTLLNNEMSDSFEARQDPFSTSNDSAPDWADFSTLDSQNANWACFPGDSISDAPKDVSFPAFDAKPTSQDDTDPALRESTASIEDIDISKEDKQSPVPPSDSIQAWAGDDAENDKDLVENYSFLQQGLIKTETANNENDDKIYW